MQSYMLIPQQGTEPADEWIRLGVEAQMANKFAEAERNYRNALRIDPRNAIATHNFSILYAQQNNLNEALLTIERALLFDSKLASLHMTYALMCLDADRIDDALAAGRKAVEMVPNKDTRLALALVSATAGLPKESIPLYNAILDEVPAHVQAGPNACFVQTLVRSTPKDLLKQRQRWYEANAFKGEKLKHKIDTEWPRPLRVGYVSGDFKTHSAAMIFRNVLAHHDNKVVLPYFYSSLPTDPAADHFSKIFTEAAGDRWRDIITKTDAEAAQMIVDDKIDILVDLAGHTNGGRLALFTHKPAPVQVTAWGFAHGTGCPEIDYFFADPISVPENERKHFAEKIYDLPSLITYEEPPYGLPDADDKIPFRQNGFITFGSCARYEKLSAECLAVFAEILRAVPDSVLRLKDSAYRRPYSIKRVLQAMPDIAPERIHFLIGTDHREHLLAYRQADIGLDPFPHGGGIVALEQLYMGVPMVTLKGTQPSGRNSASVLTVIGHPEWVANDEKEYVKIAVDMSENVKMLRETRKTLRKALMESPVVKGYREKVEEAYQDMWQQYLEGREQVVELKGQREKARKTA